MQYTDDISQNYVVETYIILLTDIIPLNLIVREKRQITEDVEISELLSAAGGNVKWYSHIGIRLGSPSVYEAQSYYITNNFTSGHIYSRALQTYVHRNICI